MRLLVILAAAALALSACGSDESLADSGFVTVQVVDIGGSTLGGVTVSAEYSTVARAGSPSVVMDYVEARTDEVGVAHFQVEPNQDYRMVAKIDLPSQPGCSYTGSEWANSSVATQTVLKLDTKSCS